MRRLPWEAPWLPSLRFPPFTAPICRAGRVHVAGGGPPSFPPRLWALMRCFSHRCSRCPLPLAQELTSRTRAIVMFPHMSPISVHRRPAPQARRLLAGSCCALCSEGDYTQVAAMGSGHNLGASPAGAPPVCCTRGVTTPARTKLLSAAAWLHVVRQPLFLFVCVCVGGGGTSFCDPTDHPFVNHPSRHPRLSRRIGQTTCFLAQLVPHALLTS